VASLVVDSTPLMVGHDPALPAAGWGSFPMVPWAGRIRRGRFGFDGVEHQLPINFEQHAIHGTGFEQSWQLVDRDATCCSMSCDLAWVFGGTSTQLIELTDDALSCTLAVRAGDRAMPASIGWHPWFVKPTRTDLRFERMYVRDDDYITDGTVVSPPPPPPWDDCFAGPLATPRVWIGDIEVSIDSACDYWVVYDMPLHATCVEPQTATPDAFNLPAETGGMVRLEPGEELRRTMTISWTQG
jgi:aldose 1-epimerase